MCNYIYDTNISTIHLFLKERNRTNNCYKDVFFNNSAQIKQYRKKIKCNKVMSVLK